MKLTDETSKKNPFRVPEDYFATLADRTMDAIRKEEASGQNQDLAGEMTGDMTRNMPGEMAGDVTRNMPGEMPGGMTRNMTGDKSGDMTTSLKRKLNGVVNLKPFMALAAAILGVAVITTVVVRLASPDRQGLAGETANSLFADLAAEEIDLYMLENELSMTEETTTEVTEEVIPSEAIIEYLMTEDIDINDIYELL